VRLQNVNDIDCRRDACKCRHVLQKLPKTKQFWQLRPVRAPRNRRLSRSIMASLSTRLIVIPALVLLIGLGATIGFSVWLGRLRVEAETASSLRLARVLVRAELADIRDQATAFPPLARLEAALPEVRHVDLLVLPAPDLLAFGEGLFMKGDAVRVPAWFARLLTPPIAAEAFPIRRAGVLYGHLVVVPNPLDEVREIWGELRFLAALLVVVAGVIVALLVVLVHRALAPIRELEEALDHLEQGRFDIALAPIRVRELRRIGARFASLARTLARLRADNHRLIDKLISIQEEERKELAHELHDAFGPALFAIRADIAGIRRAAATPDAAALTLIRERAGEMAALVDTIQGITYRMMERLRPLVLAELGLEPALRQLLDAWQARYPDLRCTLEIAAGAGEVDEALGLALYRMVQECLTNILRHAGASALWVRLAAVEAGAGAGHLRLAVSDNGSGFPPQMRFGFGLLGMSERIRALGGRLETGTGPEGGALVACVLPPLSGASPPADPARGPEGQKNG